MKIVDNVFSTKEISSTLEFLSRMYFYSAPSFLGNFGYSKFTAEKKVPMGLRDVCKTLAALVPEQEFNTVFIQSYKAGAIVNRHRDPRNNVGITIIAPFGSWTGGESTCELSEGIKKYTALPGQVVIQECTINNVQGPYHSVSKIETGNRFCIILNTII